VVILRLANVYGPGDRDRVVTLFAKAAVSNQPSTVYGKHKVVDFVWIGTVVDALLKSAFGPYVRGRVNVASGKGVNIVDLAQRVAQLTRSSSRVQIVSERDKEVGCFVADIERGGSGCWGYLRSTIRFGRWHDALGHWTRHYTIRVLPRFAWARA
jgi:UDP-glucose 4-epimerase